jgi:hypothetical protein
MNPIRFPATLDLRGDKERESCDVILFPKIRERLADVANYWGPLGYVLCNNRRGRIVVKKKANVAALRIA